MPMVKLVQQVIHMVMDSEANAQDSAIQSLRKLWTYEEVRQVMLTMVVIQQSGSMLESKANYIRELGLQMLVVTLHHACDKYDAQEASLKTNAAKYVISALEDPSPELHLLALWGIRDLSKKDSKLFMTPKAIQGFIVGLEIAIPDIQQISLECIVLAADHGK
ncbi:hypothetical protein C8R46DRAFT_1215018 [Mycena filopes]|nr:hypothetical protein C8R46DRAFT_1215018 [Mycena filopes]